MLGDGKKERNQIDYEAIFETCKVKTKQQKEFVLAYFAANYNAAEAARRAFNGDPKYAPRVGQTYLRKPNIRAAIDQIATMLVATATIEPEWVMKKLMKTIEKAEADNNHSATLRGLEILAKTMGMFIERTEITGKDGKAIEIEQRTREDVTAFKSAITSLANRGRAREDTSESLQ